MIKIISTLKPFFFTVVEEPVTPGFESLVMVTLRNYNGRWSRHLRHNFTERKDTEEEIWMTDEKITSKRQRLMSSNIDQKDII